MSLVFAFDGSDGGAPVSSLLATRSGDFIGTTSSGAIGYGEVFKLSPTASGYSETTLYAFAGGHEASTPDAGVIADRNGELFGTTYFGGSADCVSTLDPGCGTVYKLTPTMSGYRETLLYRFQGGIDAHNPHGGLLEDATGSLYGTTAYGGTGACVNGCGAVFKLQRTHSGYVERVIYSFAGPPDGANPESTLIADHGGALYGTTSAGGSTCNCGTVFKLSPQGSAYREEVLYSFEGGTDGASPIAELSSDGNGDFFGTTSAGGILGRCSGCGTVFRLTPSGSGYVETVLHAFNGKDGLAPYGGVLLDRGRIFGTTVEGAGGLCGHGCGVVYELKPKSTGYREVLIATFGGAIGLFPYASLVSVRGALYGTAAGGGAGSCLSCGVVFKISH